MVMADVAPLSSLLPVANGTATDESVVDNGLTTESEQQAPPTQPIKATRRPGRPRKRLRTNNLNNAKPCPSSSSAAGGDDDVSITSNQTTNCLHTQTNGGGVGDVNGGTTSDDSSSTTSTTNGHANGSAQTNGDLKTITASSDTSKDSSSPATTNPPTKPSRTRPNINPFKLIACDKYGEDNAVSDIIGFIVLSLPNQV